MMVVKEPPKSDVLAYTPGTPLARQAFSVILDRRGNRTFEAVVDRERRHDRLVEQIKGVQPLVLAGEYEVLSKHREGGPAVAGRDEEARHHRFRARCRSTAGRRAGPGGARAGRLLRALSYFKGDADQLLRPADRRGRRAGEHECRTRSWRWWTPAWCRCRRRARSSTRSPRATRTAPKPLAITQPKGASFTINGQEVRWQKWRFRYALHPREGLVLHTVGYEDEGRVRPILYRGIALGDGGAVRRHRQQLALAQRLRRRRVQRRTARQLDRAEDRRAGERDAHRRDVRGRRRQAVRAAARASASTSATAGCSGSTTRATRRRTNRAARASW